MYTWPSSLKLELFLLQKEESRRAVLKTSKCKHCSWTWFLSLCEFTELTDHLVWNISSNYIVIFRVIFQMHVTSKVLFLLIILYHYCLVEYSLRIKKYVCICVHLYTCILVIFY